MGVRRIVLLVVVVVVVVPAALAYVDRRSDAFGDPPEAFLLFAQDGVGFRYPPGWVVERPGAGRVVAILRPDGPRRRGGPVIVLRRAASRQLQPVSRALTVGDAFEDNSYQIDVPGAARATSLDVVAKRRDGSMHRVSTVAAVSEDDGAIMLSARGPVANGRDDPRRVAGSLTLDP